MAALVLAATSLIIGAPILGGGHLTYIDNAVHWAEILDLARAEGAGWSEIGFTGFALGTLHSPIWYPPLAWLVRHGAPLGPLYAALLVVGFAAPAFAIGFVARRRVGTVPAALLSYVVLVQAPMITGIGSPLGGMWTHSLAAAGAVLFVDRLAGRGARASEPLTWMLLAGVALTHLFALVMAALMVAVVTMQEFVSRDVDRGVLLRRAAGCCTAALASSAYWLTFVMTTDATAAPIDALSPLEVACRLVLPTDALLLLANRPGEAIQSGLYLTDALPMVGLLAAGVAGYAWRSRRPDRLAVVGFWFACVVLAAILVHFYVRISLLGPVSWRLLYWVRIGMALAAIPLLSSPRWQRLDRRAVALAMGALGTALGFWWGLPLRREHPDSVRALVVDARNLWAWLRENSSDEWGRIYLHDTFGQRWKEGGPARSHLLVLTSHHVGRPQLGTYYGVVPFATRWTLSEFDQLYGRRHIDPGQLAVSMDKTNAGVLVASSDPLRRWLAGSDSFELMHEVGRFSVWRRKGARSSWIAELRPTNVVRDVAWRNGAIDFRLTTQHTNGRVVVKTTYHPWWTLSGVPGGSLRESPEGFLLVDRVPIGDFRVELRYTPSRVPVVASAAGWMVLLGWWMVALRRRTALSPPKTSSRDHDDGPSGA